MLRANRAAMLGSSAVTVPTSYSGSSYLRRASTTQAVRSEGLASSRTPRTAGRARRVPLALVSIVIPLPPVHAVWPAPLPSGACESGSGGRPGPAPPLQLSHEFGVRRSARLPAAEYLVPRALALLIQPALVGGVEAGRERHLEHVLLAVTQVEGFFLIYLGQGPLPGAEGGRVIDIAQQLVAGLVVQGIGNHQLD